MLVGSVQRGLSHKKFGLMHSHLPLHKLNWSHQDKKKDVLVEEKAREDKVGISKQGK